VAARDATVHWNAKVQRRHGCTLSIGRRSAIYHLARLQIPYGHQPRSSLTPHAQRPHSERNYPFSTSAADCKLNISLDSAPSTRHDQGPTPRLRARRPRHPQCSAPSTKKHRRTGEYADPDGDVLHNLPLFTAPSSGSRSISGTAVVYPRQSGFTWPAHHHLTVSDGIDSATATSR